ncbi:hypothetical protein [Ferrimonas pelagia]|uniref:Uncharacterized protein n=1 Tax=Ferrimonas pelagia TaxID=1177826 RepID=A0ABP9FM99_9GAMM
MSPEFASKEPAPFSLMRIDVSFELEQKWVRQVEQVLSVYVEHPEVATEIVTSGYEDGQMTLELVYFSVDGTFKNELVWLHKALQTVVVPVPVFTIEVRQD